MQTEGGMCGWCASELRKLGMVPDHRCNMAAAPTLADVEREEVAREARYQRNIAAQDARDLRQTGTCRDRE